MVLFTGQHPLLDKFLKSWFADKLRPLARFFIRLGVRPDWLTVSGLVLNLGAPAAFARGHLQWGAVVMLLAGLCDFLRTRRPLSRRRWQDPKELNE